MTIRKPIRVFLLCTLAATAAAAQSSDPAIPPSAAAKPARRHTPRTPVVAAGPNLDQIVLDPAHGRQDPGGRLGPNLLEKDVILAFAQRLRTLLASRGFNVALTRESDPVVQAPTPNPDPTLPPIPAPQPTPLTPDTRAELANRLHPLACLILHATSSGRGVHLYTSALTPVSVSPQTPDVVRPIQLWDTAQAGFLAQSRQLAADLSQAVRNLGLPVVAGSASVSPIDSMACAAVLIELAPAAPNGGNATQPNDPGYQTRMANSILEALLLWRSQETARVAAQTGSQTSTPTSGQRGTQPGSQNKPSDSNPALPAKPRPRPRPKPSSPDGATAPAQPGAPAISPPGASL